MKKSIGIIGGLGPLATVKFMEMLNERLSTVNEEIEMVVINDPTTPDRTAYILDNSKDNPNVTILNMVKKLNKNNVDIIVMPCNTASYFYKEIINATSIPFINIVEETTKYIANKNIKKVGLLATEGTIKSKIYEKMLKLENIECIIPTDNDQKIITSIIYDGIKSGNDIDLNSFYKVSNKLIDNGAEIIILGCTELSALKEIKSIKNPIFIDAMEILAENTIKYLNIK